MPKHCQRTDAMISCLSYCKKCCYNSYPFILTVSILEISSASRLISSFKEIPVKMTSVSSSLASRRFFKSSTVIMLLSINPNSSSKISRSHSPVERTFLAKLIPFLILMISSVFFSSESSAKFKSYFSKRKILISGSSLPKNSESASPFPFKNCMIITLFPKAAIITASPSAAGDFPCPSPLYICTIPCLIIHLTRVLSAAFWQYILKYVIYRIIKVYKNQHLGNKRPTAVFYK